MTNSPKILATVALASAAFAAPLAANAATTDFSHAATAVAAPAVFAAAPRDALEAGVGADTLVVPGHAPEPAHVLRAQRRGSAPEPSTWAMMLMGFGAAGVLVRRRGGGAVYRLVEALPGGEEVTEEFAAPDDATAWKRATMVAEGHVQLWRGDERIAPVLNA